MAFTMKLSASLLLVLFISYHHPVSGDSSSNSEEEESPSSQPLPPLDTAAAKLNLFNLISPGQPAASGPFMMPQVPTKSAPAEEEEEEEEGGAGVQTTTQTPLPEIHLPLQPIQLPIPRVPLPPAPIPQQPSVQYPSVQPPSVQPPSVQPPSVQPPSVQPPPGIITISSPSLQVGNSVIPRPMAPLYPVAPMMPTRPLPQTPPSDDIYCIMSTGDCVPSNSVCNGVVLNSFCSGPSRSCCVPLNSNRAFGL